LHLQETAAMPWAGGGEGSVRGHEFHHSSLENLDPGTVLAYRVQRGHGVDGAHDGVCVHNLLASYAHLRTGAGAQWAPRFVAHVRQQRQRRQAEARKPAAVVAARAQECLP
jgi:cobyrinic acid a,c-diamide synthase